jgi:crotonobetainyl-CoA:carnitine CoA-transferase CaiB-like acyl-CoA transferase
VTESAAVQPLAGLLVVDLTRLLPGPYASRELRRLGARVVRLEAPEGDPLRLAAPQWDAFLNAGKESVVCDLKADADFANALLARADVVLEGFRPRVAERLGLVVPSAAVYCSITGFGEAERAAQAGHDLNYLGYAGVLADTAPAVPPIPVADLAAGALGAVVEILAALVKGDGARIVVSMAHQAHRLVDYRLEGDPVPRLLTGGTAYYRVYPTADGRHLTVAALEPKFFGRLCELLDRPELAERQFDSDQETLAADLATTIASRSLDEWLARFDGEDVCAGPVSTIAEAAKEFGTHEPAAPAPLLGEHTNAWRRALTR